jgi:outer membrane protein assembly factor BamB
MLCSAALTCENDQAPAVASGRLLWKYASEVGCRLRPPMSDGVRAFVPFADGYLRAFDLRTGALAWSTQIGGTLHDDMGVFGDRLVVQADFSLPALDPATGQVLWWGAGFALDAPRGILAYDTSRGLVFTGTWGGRVVALRLADGSVAWQRSMGDYVQVTMVAGNRLFIGMTSDSVQPAYTVGHIVAMDLDSLRQVWTFLAPVVGQAASGFVTRFAYASGAVIANASSGILYSVASATGEELWRFESRSSLGGPIADGDRVFMPSSDGYLRTVSSRTGTQEWETFYGGGSLYTEPALMGDSLVVVKVGPKVYGVSRTNGATRWQYTIRYANICSAPLVVGKTVVVDAEDGIYAIEAP